MLSAMSIFFVILMYAGWSSMFSIGKLALVFSPPLFLTGARMALAGLLLLTFFYWRQRASVQITKKHVLCFLLLGVFSIYLTNALEFWSLQYLSAAKTCFIYSLSPFFSAFFSYLHFGEKMNGRKWLGMGIGLFGIFPVLLLQKNPEEHLLDFFHLSWPEIAMMGASLCTVYGWVLLRLIVKDFTIAPSLANGASMLFGGILALIHSYFVESWTPFPVSAGNTFSFLQILGLMILVSNVLCYNIYRKMLKRFTATFLSFMGVLSPIFASLFSWLFLQEPPSIFLLFSTAIISLGLWLIYSAEIKQGYTQPASNTAKV